MKTLRSLVVLLPSTLTMAVGLAGCFSPGEQFVTSSGGGMEDTEGSTGGAGDPATGDGSTTGGGPGSGESSAGSGEPDPSTSSTSGGSGESESTGSTTDEVEASTGEPDEGSTGEIDPSRVVFLLPYAGAPMDYGGLAGADALCQAAAEDAGLPGTFMAWLSGGLGVGVVDRFNLDGGPFVLTDGTEIAADWADLTDGTLAAPIVFDADGAEHGVVSDFPETLVITHTNADGSAAGGFAPCAAYTADGIEAGQGSAEAQDTSWSRTGDTWACDNGLSGGPSLYCFEQ